MSGIGFRTSKWLRAVLAACVFVPLLWAQNSLRFIDEAPLPDLGGHPLPVWAGGALVLVERATGSAIHVTTIGRDGALLGTIGVAIPESQYVTVTSFDRAEDGTVAFSGASAAEDGRSASFVGWTTPDGGTPTIVRTSPYRPFSVALAPDGTIWTVGSESKPRSEWPPPPSTPQSRLSPTAGAIRHYAANGALLGEFLPQSEVENPLALHSTRSIFDATDDGVVWYASEEAAWVEITPQGQLVRIAGVNLPNDERETGFASTSRGLFLSTIGRLSSSVLKFDRELRQWQIVQHVEFGAGPSRGTRLFGAEGDTLVTWEPEMTGKLRFLSILD